MPLSSTSISDRRVYAQDTAPADDRDGILWVDTSVSPRETYVYSTDSASWESVTPSSTGTAGPTYGYQVTEITGDFDDTSSDNDISTSSQVSVSGGSTLTAVADTPDTTSDGLKIHAYMGYADVGDAVADVTANFADGTSTTLATGVAFTGEWHSYNYSLSDLTSVTFDLTNNNSSSSNFKLGELRPHSIAMPEHSHTI